MTNKLTFICFLKILRKVPEVGPVLLSLAAHTELIQISGVDAANPESLENALRGVTGPICISTEGMMMYFTETEASPD